MKRLLRFIPAFAALLVLGCNSDPIDDNPAPDDDDTQNPSVHEIVTLSDYDLTFSNGDKKTLTVTADITGVTVDASEFVLQDEDGKEPQYVSINSYEYVSENVISLTLRDKRPADSNIKKYTELVYVVHAPTSVRSDAPLRLRSTPYFPVVRITTTVPQNYIDKNNWTPGTIEIDGGGDYSDLEKMNAEIKGRGNSTWSWEKKPYAIKLESKKEVMDMPKHKRWCLIANYMDRTHMRNRVAYHISENTGLAYTTRNRYVELYFNDKYQGLYLLTEQIKEDKNRVDITELSPSDTGDAITGGYLLEFDTNYDEDKRFHTSASYIPVNLKYPDAADITSEQWDYIKGYVNSLDEAVWKLGQGLDDSSEVFRMLDRQSMIDFWIVFELMANHEVLHPKSVYFHKDRGGKLIAGPVWDFDYQTLTQSTANSWINYNLSYYYSEFPWFEQNWWNVLLSKDLEFKHDVKTRWNELYPFLTTIPDYIEAQQEYISDAEARNYQRWPSINGTGNPNGDERLSFNDAVKRLKDTYTSRLLWMNTQIAGW
ncbi:MAG: CotH kinase family protein [Alistipes sp.]|nr:CotH kinase family protein [Alistipes sp.]